MFKYERNDSYTNTERGLVYGLFFGAAFGFMVYCYMNFVLLSNTIFTGTAYEISALTAMFALTGVGLVAGLIVGGSLQEKGSKKAVKSAPAKAKSKKKKK